MSNHHFRNYEKTKMVEQTYKNMHEQQTIANVKKLQDKWYPLTHAVLTIPQALDLLDRVIDDSDPDLPDIPNHVHAYQTAEAIRKVRPNDRALQLTGLIHDLGKIMQVLDPEHPGWATVGDTYCLGCKFSDKIVFSKYFAGCPDTKVPAFSSQYGIYKPGCGLDKLIMTFGHDCYLAHVLENGGKCLLPKCCLDIIRYHSFYALHTAGEYTHFLTEFDKKNTLPHLQFFNSFDLYSKNPLDTKIKQETKKYYATLIEEYLPGVFHF